MTFRFACLDLPPSIVKPPADKPAPKPADLPKTPDLRRRALHQQMAWRQAKAMAQRWLKCMSDEATQLARASNEPAYVVADAVAAACARWEHTIHAVLVRAGEDDRDFEAALHGQIVAFAAAKIKSVRAAREAPTGPRPSQAASQAHPASHSAPISQPTLPGSYQ